MHQPSSSGSSGEADITIDQVIEATADAITQLVVFSLEAEENNSILPRIVPGAEAVSRTVDALVAIVESMAAGYQDEPTIQQKNDASGRCDSKCNESIEGRSASHFQESI
jgi:hypothetical protein